MATQTEQEEKKGFLGSIKGFTQAFWVANTVELLERLAYYAVFIVLTIYLSNIWGFSDIEAGIISGIFSALLYLLPTFSGAYADKIGFRSAIILAFSLLTIGYAGLGILPTLLESAGLVSYGFGDGTGSAFSEYLKNTSFVTYDTETVFSGLEKSSLRWTIAPVLLLIVIGGSFIKAVISGTVARETSESNRARGYAVFYMMVNIGAFTGKTVVDPLRKALGDSGLVYLNYFSAFMTLAALIAVYFFYKSVQTQGRGKSFKEIWQALIKVCCNGKLIALIIIVSGFWVVQQQLYASMPKYVLRMVGEGASPGWYANVNPFIVFLCVNLVTSFMRNKKAITSMTIGMFIIPLSALIMSMGNVIGDSYILGLHPVAFMMIIGIVFQALAECFISPRFLEYFSLQSPKGEEGLYLGFSHLHSFLSSIIAFIAGGALLEKFCPDPKNFIGGRESLEYTAATEHAHYLWYVFVGIGIVSAVALVIYNKVVSRKG
ncbi:dipeptide/tripeptide permease [Dysgonomonadaceae bacterium PH5-43]|nr:dipeptide/tripeptide permease [Dysgonomonadaceae bacterium PH5-43]